MKLVLLPGMDGTGMLFDRLIALLPLDCQIIVLPKGADQSYTYLTEYCIGRLPREDFVLLAESFSGPIAARIASDRHPNLKAVIFVATFLQPPSPPLLKLARLISPLTLLHFPFAHWGIRVFCIGAAYPMERFFQALSDVGRAVLEARLIALAGLQANEIIGCNSLPVLILSAQKDSLVAKDAVEAIKKRFPNHSEYCLPGTHFLAQTNPNACAERIIDFLQLL